MSQQKKTKPKSGDAVDVTGAGAKIREQKDGRLGAGKTLCIDFDGVLAQYEEFMGAVVFGDPIPGAREFMLKLKELGYRLLIYTARLGEGSWDQDGHTQKEVHDALVRWFERHSVPFDEIYTKIGKPRATAYVDDHAVRCTPVSNLEDVNTRFVYTPTIDAINTHVLAKRVHE